MARFYGHFAAAYGTIWFCLMLAAVATQSRINAGLFGLCGFPVIALVYALIRNSTAGGPAVEVETLRERVRWLESQLPHPQPAPGGQWPEAGSQAICAEPNLSPRQDDDWPPGDGITRPHMP